MSEKKFSPIEVVLELKKSIKDLLQKADPVLSSILSDLSDKNSVAQVPKQNIPSGGEGVLYKIDGQQQSIPAPSLKNNVPPNFTAMKLRSQTPSTPAGASGGSGPKKPSFNIGSKLKGFMQKKEEKRASFSMDSKNINKTNNLMEKNGFSIAKLRQEMAESQGVPVGPTGLVPKVKQDPITGKKTILNEQPSPAKILPMKAPKISLPKDPKEGG